MSIINVFALTFSAIVMTLTGEVPISTWYPLIEDIFDSLMGVIL
jgi:hypothetical protein